MSFTTDFDVSEWEMLDSADGSDYYVYRGTDPTVPQFVEVDEDREWDGSNHATWHTLSDVERNPDYYPAAVAKWARTH